MDEKEENNFIEEEITKIITDSIEAVVGNESFKNEKVGLWSGSIVEKCLASLIPEQKPYKYIIHCSIMQNNGAGLHLACSSFWNHDTDGVCTVRWKNKFMVIVVSCFGLGI